MNRDDRRVLKHAAKLLRDDARCLRESHQDSSGVIDSISVNHEIADLCATAARLRDIAGKGRAK